MEWFLVISMFGDPDVLVKPMHSKMECLKLRKEFNKINKNELIESVTCEQGELMESYNVKGESDEIM